MTFEALNLTAPLLRAVNEAGYTEPSPIQEKAIPPVLAGRDLLGCAQTGTGKTAAFALPMLQNLTARPAKKKGAIRALILTPTRELALQIGQSFADYGKYERLSHTVIFGGVGQQPQVAALRRGVDILVACPGRLNDLIGQGFIDLANVEFFVLDEADRMLDMGFIHDVKKVIAKLPPKTARQTLLFSATMPAEIETLADTLLNDPVSVKVDPVSSTVDRIAQSLYFVEKGNKKKLLPYLIQHLEPAVTNALVFSRTKHGADKIVKDLTAAGIPAAAIHGNKSQNARVAALDGFKAGQTRVLVATDIAARGIDISELAYVFNYDLPEVPETYVHRIGRTARAGADGCAVSFCSSEEKEYLAGIEKLNRKKIPVVSGHPWDGVPDPPRAEAPLRGRRPEGRFAPAAAAEPAAPVPEQPHQGRGRTTRAQKQEQALAALAAEQAVNNSVRKEVSFMEDQEKRPEAGAQGEGLSASAKRRRRRRRGKGGSENGAPQAGGQNTQNGAQGGQSAPRPQAPQGRGSNNQPKFDPHFLTPQAASQAQGGRAQQNARQAAQLNGQPRNDRRPGDRGPRPAQNAPRNERSDRSEQRPPRTEQPARQAGRSETPARPAKGGQPARAPKDEDPGLLLISRKAPNQKFTSFEDYMTAHGGETAPIEDHTDEKD